MITIWDLHHDEYKRLNFFIGNTIRYVGETCPVADRLIVSEGSSNKVPADQIAKTILYPCVKDTAFLHKKGYRYAFTKDQAQGLSFGGTSLILPPLFEQMQTSEERTTPACSMIHLLEQRDKKALQFIRNLRLTNYGLPHNPCRDVDVLAKTKFLVHPKTIGYLCNAVIKATSLQTPVIFTEESYKFGYQDYLKPDVSCIVVKNEHEANLAMQMSDKQYKRMQEEIAASVQRVRDSYDQIKAETAAFIQNVWPV
jgi:hypothetical protein